MENYLIAVDLGEALFTSDKKIKFKTIRFVRKLYKKENLMGFGDQLNDKSLFELPIGVAMINASDDIKNLAKYVTKKRQQL